MMENSALSESKELAMEAHYLSEQEVVLLMMFRVISVQRKKDVLRVLEVFTQSLE